MYYESSIAFRDVLVAVLEQLDAASGAVLFLSAGGNRCVSTGTFICLGILVNC